MSTNKIPLISVTNVTTTGDVSSTTTYNAGVYTLDQQVVGLRGASVPTLVVGALKFNGSAFVFDNTAYQPLDGDLTAIAAMVGTSGLARKTATNTWVLDTATYLTANQNITLSGDVSGSGTTAVTTTIQPGAVTLTKLANLPAMTLIGNNTGGAAVPAALNVSDLGTMLSGLWLPLNGGTLTGNLNSRGIYNTGPVGFVNTGAAYGYAFSAQITGDTLHRIGINNEGAIVWSNGSSLAYGTLYYDPTNFALRFDGSKIMANAYKVVNGTELQFMKADGSLDSTSYLPLTAGSANPLSGLLYVQNLQVGNVAGSSGNGAGISYAGYNVSGSGYAGMYANSTGGVFLQAVAGQQVGFVVAGTTIATVSSAGFTASNLTVGGLVGVGARPLVTSADGLVIAQDATTFRTTIGAISGNQTITLSGDATGSGTTSITTSIAATVVTSKVLTGYVAGTNAVLQATDTILTAFGKLQAQATATSGTLTTHTHSASAIVSGVLPIARGGTGEVAFTSGYMIALNGTISTIAGNGLQYYGSLTGGSPGFWTLLPGNGIRFNYNSGNPVIEAYNVTNTSISDTAAIAWSKVNKSGAVAGDVGALALSGGTLTGALFGTSATFSSTLKYSGGIFMDLFLNAIYTAFYPSGVTPSNTPTHNYGLAFNKNGGDSYLNGTVQSNLAVGGVPIVRANATGAEVAGTLSTTSYANFNGYVRPNWSAGWKIVGFGNSASFAAVNGYGLICNNVYSDGHDNRSIDTVGASSYFGASADGKFYYQAAVNNGANGIVALPLTSQFTVDISGNGAFTGKLYTGSNIHVIAQSESWSEGVSVTAASGFWGGYRLKRADDSVARDGNWAFGYSNNSTGDFEWDVYSGSTQVKWGKFYKAGGGIINGLVDADSFRSVASMVCGTVVGFRNDPGNTAIGVQTSSTAVLTGAVNGDISIRTGASGSLFNVGYTSVKFSVGNAGTTINGLVDAVLTLTPLTAVTTTLNGTPTAIPTTGSVFTLPSSGSPSTYKNYRLPNPSAVGVKRLVLLTGAYQSMVNHANIMAPLSGTLYDLGGAPVTYLDASVASCWGAVVLYSDGTSWWRV